MEQKDGRSFNCAESVIIRVSRNATLPHFNESCMRLASILGGGIAGTGEICGALTGGIMCLALLLGTNGEEPLGIFKEKRDRARAAVKGLIHNFTENWGNLQCRHLLAMDEGKERACGTLRSGSPSNLCEEYVNWIVQKIAEMQNNRFLD
jgi:C_GCAxxG_C_C family probable redox protein